jgi:hypothetical protein
MGIVSAYARDPLKRARELVDGIPNKRALAQRLQKEGYDPEDVRAILDQVFEERKARKRAGALQERVLSRLLDGEELDDLEAARALGDAASKRRSKFADLTDGFASKRKAALLAVVVCVILPVLFGLVTGEWGKSIRGLVMFVFIGGSGLGYTVKMHRYYARQVARLDELADRYGWWGAGGPETS